MSVLLRDQELETIITIKAKHRELLEEYDHFLKVGYETEDPDIYNMKRNQYRCELNHLARKWKNLLQSYAERADNVMC